MSDDNPSPNRPDRDDSIPRSVWEQIDRICDRYEQAWQAEESPKLEDYLVSDLPANQLRALFGALMAVELDRIIASSTGEHVRNPTPGATRRIGPYKLLQQIGEGGMGTVWMADQEEPVRRRVAVKLIKGGQDSRQVIARFEAERQALAMMDHQNIAKVLDAGTTDDGAPFFVMELVQGEPITAYCDRNKLTPRERLELFVPVCRAVQHAHQKGIIHRDLKPSNILVQIYDGKPMAKVIDFGLAKALQHQTRLTDKTLFTEFGQVVGTVQYMSPEQARLDAVDIDTRSDIYSLGVMLYELLTGSTPLTKETAQRQAMLQVLQSIREVEPPRPSQRLSSSGDKITEISKQRNIDPHQLQRILRGDIDWVVMKSLEKDRVRRYATANEFAEDVERYIQGDAVEARRPTVAYKVSKFVRRNRGIVVTTVTIMALLVAGIVTSSWFAMKADRAAILAKQEKDRADAEAKQAQRNEEKAIAAQAAIAAEQRRTKQALAESEVTRARSNYLLASARWNEHRVAEAAALLDSIPRQYRNFEWYRDRRRLLGSDVTYFGHKSYVNSVAFSPDGSRIVSGSFDKTLKLWDASSGAEILTLAGHTDRVTSVAFSPDGNRLISGSGDSNVTLWNAGTGEELLTIEGDHTYVVGDVAFSLDGSRIVSGSFNGNWKIWDAQTGANILTLAGIPQGTSVAFSPDGSRIVTGGGELRLWDAHSGAEIQSLTGNTDSVTSLAVRLDGNCIVSGSEDGTLKLWDAPVCTEILTLRGHTSWVDQDCVAFSPDGTSIVSGSQDKTLKLWDALTGAESKTLIGHDFPVSNVAFNSDGTRVYSKSWFGNEEFVWDSKNGCRLSNERWKAVSAMSSSPDGRWIVVPSGRNVLLVDQDFKNQPDEKAYRESKARLDPIWHSQQAESAEKVKDWYSATFHWAWVLSVFPDRALPNYRLHTAHQRLTTQHDHEKTPLDGNLAPIVTQMLTLPFGNVISDANQLYDFMVDKLEQPETKVIGNRDFELIRLFCVEFARELTDNPARAFAAYRFHRAMEICIDRISVEEANDLRSHATVQQALSLPIGDKLSPSEAQIIKEDTWLKVSSSKTTLTETDLKFMRLVCEKHPKGAYWNTLAVTEYRLGNFQEAIDAALQSLEKTPKEMGYDSPYPVDLAILAMSRFKLGETDKANEYRRQLNEVMKLDEWKGDKKGRSFIAEVDKLFEAADNSGDEEVKPSEVATPEGQESDAASPE